MRPQSIPCSEPYRAPLYATAPSIVQSTAPPR
jgi:hypothetical protein